LKRCLQCDDRFTSETWTCPACRRTPAVSNGIITLAPELAAGNSLDADYTFDALAAAEATHFWFRSRAQIVLWALRRYFPRLRSVLEIGCGMGTLSGAMSSSLPHVKIMATDVLLEALSRAQCRFPNVEFVQMDVTHLPFEEEFDVAAAFDVIEHLDDDRAALHAMRDAVKPGGGVLITVPQHPSLWSAVDDFSHHRRRYTRSELRSKLQSAGFTVVRMTSFASIVLPLLIVSRRRSVPFDPERELRVPAAANRILSALSRVERLLIEGGCSLPAGGSLLVAARRSV